MTSSVTFIEDNYNYVNKGEATYDTLITNYYRFISKNDTSAVDVVDASSQVCIYYKFSSPSNKILPIVANDSISFVDEDNNIISFTYAIKLSVENGIIYYYIILTNITTLNENTNYYVIINSLKDSLELEITPPQILHVSPGVELIDFAIHKNTAGEYVRSIGLFTDALDDNEQNTVKIDGIVDGGVKYYTEAPTEVNPYGIKICVLESLPTTMYDGWLYLVEGTTPTTGEYYVVKSTTEEGAYFLVKSTEESVVADAYYIVTPSS